MSINRGTGSIKRRHGKNYISEQADARLREAVQPYQEQGKRALEVDSFAVKYYYQSRSTTVCTCKETKILPQYAALGTNVPPNLVQTQSVLGASVSIDYRRQLFGSQSDAIQSDDGDMDLDEDLNISDGDEEDAPRADALYSSAADCCICYKTGYVPGYSSYGFERLLLTTHNLFHSRGYTTNVTKAPHVFEKVDQHHGYLEFEIEVPRYFQSVLVSVRNNKEVLSDQVYDSNGMPLSFAAVKRCAGQRVVVRLYALEVTHAVIEFDLGTDKTLANLAQQQKTIDWTLFSTLGNIQIILPMTIQTVSASDVIYVPKRNVSFKITDVTYLTTSRDRNLDWSVSTRVLQPQEALGRIYRSQKLA